MQFLTWLLNNAIALEWTLPQSLQSIQSLGERFYFQSLNFNSVLRLVILVPIYKATTSSNLLFRKQLCGFEERLWRSSFCIIKGYISSESWSSHSLAFPLGTHFKADDPIVNQFIDHYLRQSSAYFEKSQEKDLMLVQLNKMQDDLKQLKMKIAIFCWLHEPWLLEPLPEVPNFDVYAFQISGQRNWCYLGKFWSCIHSNWQHQPPCLLHCFQH